MEAYSQCLISDKIKLKVAVLDKLRNNNFNLETAEQEHTNNALILLECLELNKLVALLDEDQILSTIPNKSKPSNVLNSKLEPERWTASFE